MTDWANAPWLNEHLFPFVSLKKLLKKLFNLIKVDETLIMCKMRELNVGDGFPRGELAATYNPERIVAINAISAVIG